MGLDYLLLYHIFGGLFSHVVGLRLGVLLLFRRFGGGLVCKILLQLLIVLLLLCSDAGLQCLDFHHYLSLGIQELGDGLFGLYLHLLLALGLELAHELAFEHLVDGGLLDVGALEGGSAL